MSSIFYVSNKVLETPEFIPSLTSVKSSYNYLNLLEYLTSQTISHYMISAYDLNLFKDKITKFNFEKFQKRSNLFFMDSGAFEIYNNIHSQKWNNNLLIKTALNFKPDILVSLDYISSEKIVNSKNELNNYEIIRKKLKKTPQFYELVIQNTKLKEIRKFLNNLEVDKKLFAICIPERNLGLSFLNRYQKLQELIKLIKVDYSFDQILLHLMGCSNPSSIIKYSKLGVDLFDGIHWQDMIFNPLNNDLIDFSNLMDLNCECKFCNEFKKNIKNNENFLEKYYMFYALSHNLFNYKLLMKKIRNEMI